MKPEELAEQLAAVLKKRPYFYAELLREFPGMDYRTFLLGWSELRTRYKLERDAEGHYLMERRRPTVDC